MPAGIEVVGREQPRRRGPWRRTWASSRASSGRGACRAAALERADPAPTRDTRRQKASGGTRAWRAALAWPATITAAFIAPAEVPEIPSICSHGSSRSRSITPQVKAPCEPPPCRARSTATGSRPCVAGCWILWLPWTSPIGCCVAAGYRVRCRATPCGPSARPRAMAGGLRLWLCGVEPMLYWPSVLSLRPSPSRARRTASWGGGGTGRLGGHDQHQDHRHRAARHPRPGHRHLGPAVRGADLRRVPAAVLPGRRWFGGPRLDHAGATASRRLRRCPTAPW